jgi:L-amino acid N-acyltransferase YncA
MVPWGREEMRRITRSNFLKKAAAAGGLALGGGLMSACAVVVVEEDGEVVAFAAASSYRPRECYGGVAEFSVYVDRGFRRRGAGRLAMRALIEAAEKAGFWKLLSRVFVENASSRRLLRSLGFREVGVYEKHARLDGRWRDVVIVELLIPSNLT